MLDSLKKTLNRNLLKYSAGRAITCPHCGAIADYRKWVIAESPTGANMWQGCADCFDSIGTIPDGWEITRETTPAQKRKPRLPLTVSVKIKTGDSVTVPAAKAFTLYGREFLAHQSILSDGAPNKGGLWTVTEKNSGYAVAQGRKSKAAAIRDSRALIERVGPEKLEAAIARITGGA